ncbi:hypothetical protein I79_000656 [Cricetulus griseus]|uniref:Uncharacterized protein n=1 Tax=Cricetulus griseus TaxID=10029 RepID=G3GSN9_CRIGR|nr:hypothetical protein I79_000656 [Cricetulus griseus]
MKCKQYTPEQSVSVCPSVPTLFFETEFLCVALEPILALTLETKLASNSEIRLPLPP